MVSFESDSRFRLVDVALRIFVMIDEQGFRLGVGIVLVNKHGKLFFAQRVGLPEAWQFPQGGICEGESPEDGMYRELFEELGLERDDVKLIRETSRWLNYYLPKHMRRYRSQPLCVYQLFNEHQQMKQIIAEVAKQLANNHSQKTLESPDSIAHKLETYLQYNLNPENLENNFEKILSFMQRIVRFVRKHEILSKTLQLKTTDSSQSRIRNQLPQKRKFSEINITDKKPRTKREVLAAAPFHHSPIVTPFKRTCSGTAVTNNNLIAASPTISRIQAF